MISKHSSQLSIFNLTFGLCLKLLPNEVKVILVKSVVLSVFFIFSMPSFSQENVDSIYNSKIKKVLNVTNNLSFKTYGVVNYYNFDWETFPDKRNAVDLERINMYMKYKFSDAIHLKTEFEFEHGGTGSTMEFDVFEEFGEFEAEIEAGGEVLIEH